jgi:hypothetical protein
MPRFRYRTFLSLFALGNGIAWFLLLFLAGRWLLGMLSAQAELPTTATIALLVGLPLTASVLAAQGAIVNLRAQFLLGRFRPPLRTRSVPPPGNPWWSALRIAPAFSVPQSSLAVVSTYFIGHLADLDRHHAAVLLGVLGAVQATALARLLAGSEFEKFYSRLGDLRPAARSVGTYVGVGFALPWGVINGVLNAGIGIIQYRIGQPNDGLITTLDLRTDLSLMTFLICLFMAVATIPEVETDFAAGVAPPMLELPPMPPLLLRYLAVIGLAGAVWLAVTAISAFPFAATITPTVAVSVKSFGGALLGAAASARSAVWALARCHQRAGALHASPPTLS